ncbi:hypothetical protein T492DRAFT_288813 [Pavlovales sp. CCMP2436]|nr:hypothetical protein T492DRAFT_288813 [Pavlovales sp. CCMP2436]
MWRRWTGAWANFSQPSTGWASPMTPGSISRRTTVRGANQEPRGGRAAGRPPTPRTRSRAVRRRRGSAAFVCPASSATTNTGAVASSTPPLPTLTSSPPSPRLSACPSPRTCPTHCSRPRPPE